MRLTSGRMALTLAIAAVGGCAREAAPPPQRPPTVLVSTPVTDEVADFEDFTGQTMAVFTENIRARVTGYLEKVNFKDGDEVKEGDLLCVIDPRPYQADYDRAKATLAQTKARLARLERDLARGKTLRARGAIGIEEFDRIQGDHDEAEAAVGVAQAALDMADLNLQFTRVKAPISGRLSRRLVDPGNLVQADQTILTSIVTLDPMYVYFDIDERTLLKLRRMISEGQIRSRQQGAEIRVLAALADEEGYPHTGVINFSDNQLDVSTGTLRVRAVIDNPEPRVLSPGLFMRVRLPVGQPHQAILVPEQAVGTDQGQKYLYIVRPKKDDKGQVVKDPDGKPVYVAIRQDVTVGSLNGQMRVVEKGLAGGEQIIVTGLQRVKPGATVEPRPTEKATAKAQGAPRVAAG